MKRTGPTNPQLQTLIIELKKKGKEIPLFNRIASDLVRPSRQRIEVNLSRLNVNTNENDIVVVPGKVLGSGNIDHKITVAAYKFSQGAIDKLKASNSKAILLNDLLKEPIKGKKVRIIG